MRNYGNHVEVDIKDDGKGFNVAEIRASTHGLAGMRHRVEAAGGRLTVISAPGNGNAHLGGAAQGQSRCIEQRVISESSPFAVGPVLQAAIPPTDKQSRLPLINNG